MEHPVACPGWLIVVRRGQSFLSPVSCNSARSSGNYNKAQISFELKGSFFVFFFYCTYILCTYRSHGYFNCGLLALSRNKNLFIGDICRLLCPSVYMSALPLWQVPSGCHFILYIVCYASTCPSDFGSLFIQIFLEWKFHLYYLIAFARIIDYTLSP